jgi:hypothetical protein
LFSVLIVLTNMPWRVSILVMSLRCPGGFLNLNGHLFLKIW